MNKTKIFLVTSLLIIGACTAPSGENSTAELATDHFHPKGKVPSEYTLKVFEEAKAKCTKVHSFNYF